MQRHVICLLLLAAALPGQKAETTLEWQKRAITIRYEALPVGDHSLAKLAIGRLWRLGASHDASTFLAMSPILAGDAWIAPGHYRVQLQRDSETECVLIPEGAQHMLERTDVVRIPGTLSKLAQPAKKLAIELSKKGAATAGNQGAEVGIRFGADAWRGELLILGHKAVALAGGSRLAVFRVPAERLARGPVAIATLHRSKDLADSWNIMLDQDRVRLVPWAAVPKTIDDAIPELDAAAIKSGTVTKLDLAVAPELPVLELREATLQKGELRLVVAHGKTAIECKLPEPKAKGGS